MSWISLLDYEGAGLNRGAVLKFSAGGGFEDEVVMIVCESPDNDVRRLALMVVTGYKAGINCYVVFPEEAVVGGLSTHWLIENWGNWVCPGGNVAQVLVKEGLRVEDIS